MSVVYEPGFSCLENSATFSGELLSCQAPFRGIGHAPFYDGMASFRGNFHTHASASFGPFVVLLGERGADQPDRG